ncbi:MAG: hypothetical protein IPJ88_14600 [Myxococcales bacterium]|nr:MAG: hypothetical protein IPJ88_14600 [Myxococcales bacterium]
MITAKTKYLSVSAPHVVVLGLVFALGCGLGTQDEPRLGQSQVPLCAEQAERWTVSGSLPLALKVEHGGEVVEKNNAPLHWELFSGGDAEAFAITVEGEPAPVELDPDTGAPDYPVDANGNRLSDVPNQINVTLASLLFVGSTDGTAFDCSGAANECNGDPCTAVTNYFAIQWANARAGTSYGVDNVHVLEADVLIDYTTLMDKLTSEADFNQCHGVGMDINYGAIPSHVTLTLFAYSDYLDVTLDIEPSSLPMYRDPDSCGAKSIRLINDPSAVSGDDKQRFVDSLALETEEARLRGVQQEQGQMLAEVATDLRESLPPEATKVVDAQLSDPTSKPLESTLVGNSEAGVQRCRYQ